MQNIEINYIEYCLRALHIASQEVAPNMKTNTMRFTHKQLKPLRLPAGQSKLPEGQSQKERGSPRRGLARDHAEKACDHPPKGL